MKSKRLHFHRYSISRETNLHLQTKDLDAGFCVEKYLPRLIPGIPFA
jgi:hypothetical protein